jgi:hypothetical protein
VRMRGATVHPSASARARRRTKRPAAKTVRLHHSFRRRTLRMKWSGPFSRTRRARSLVGSMFSLRLGWSISSHTHRVAVEVGRSVT